MRMLADDDEVLSTTAAKSQPSQQPAWMRTLLERCREWLDQLPVVCTTCCTISFRFNVLPLQTFNTLAKQSAESDPLYRLFSREGTVGRKLLEQVRKDLADVVKVCRAELKQTNHLRTLMSCLTKGV